MTHIASPIAAGTAAPDFSTILQDGSKRSLADYSGSKLVLYFYPKDMTPGCTAQACNLNENLETLTEAGIRILGVSPDPVSKHEKFIAKYDLGFDLAADEDRSMHLAYGVWGLKKFMGREYEGTHRTTFLIEENGMIASVIHKPKTANHAAEVMTAFGL